MTWIKKPLPLKAGPLGSNSYTMDITGLTPSTKYEYRAYFIVDGVEYYGDILSGTTASITYTPPTVTTGDAYLDDTNPSESIRITGNTITDKGGAPILEYGVLYTNLAAYATTDKLVLTNYPTVNKSAMLDDAKMNPYFIDDASYSIKELTPNTTYFYRSYAKNAIGTSYGTIKNITTSAPINVDVNLRWVNPGQQGSNDGIAGVYRLYCCDGTIVKSKNVPYGSKNITSNWVVSAGCYYVDFTGLKAIINDTRVAEWDFYWNIDNSYSGTDCCTACFNSSVSINARMTASLFI